MEIILAIGVMAFIGGLLTFGLWGKTKATCGDDCNCDCE
tara:strand:+ start:1238 stop:1354 length:117 start_codon:yes stop_codon:yes gene_type:complete